jgi:hypothetical protein
LRLHGDFACGNIQNTLQRINASEPFTRSVPEASGPGSTSSIFLASFNKNERVGRFADLCGRRVFPVTEAHHSDSFGVQNILGHRQGI